MKESIKRLPPFPETNPELLKEWDYEKNKGLDPFSLSKGCQTKVWWKCKINPLHRWPAMVVNRTGKNRGCPFCVGQRTIPEESLAALRPGLMEEWHPTRNEGINPWSLGIGSQVKVWWRCSEGHEWPTMVKSRAKDDKGCRWCEGRVASEKNSLATVFPEIAEEWHPTKNDRTPRDVTSKNHYRAWWRCRTCLHEWQVPVNMRTVSKSGCPLCGHDEGALKSKKVRFEKEESIQPNYDYEPEAALSANAQALRLLASQMKTETERKNIVSLLNPRLLSRIDYHPHYQRNYVWDNNKATYFIESVLIGTEVPPLIFFETQSGFFEVIDGRQRFETLKRFSDDHISLSPKGLTVRKDLANKSFSELTKEDKDYFFDANLRVIRFSVVNPVDEHTQDMLKKEIFRRYNSGITPLRRLDIEKAVYIKDEPTDFIKGKFHKNKNLYGMFTKLFLGIAGTTMPDVMEKALQEARFLLVCAQMPILSTRKRETLQHYYELFSDSLEDVLSLFRTFVKRVERTNQLSSFFEEQGVSPTSFWNEVVYWAFAILDIEGLDSAKLMEEGTKKDLLNLYHDNERAYAPAEPQFFYMQFLTRYQTMASFIEKTYEISLASYIRKQRGNSKQDVMAFDAESGTFTRIEKQDPTSVSVDDLCREITRSRFLLRPSYQRKEVINRTKSSGIIESILLDIKLPPLYAFRRTDGVCEIIDGQQRILSILGYLGQPFLDENNRQVFSDKKNFNLSKLRILDSLENKTFQDIDQTLQNRIWDYNLSIITIDEKYNKGFSPIDLFIRLNSRPYPIKENTFEMWNSYSDKDIIDSIKQLTDKYNSWFYSTRNNKRMKNEELLAVLTYLTYTQITKSAERNHIDNVVDIFRTPGGIGVRIKQKSGVTRMMDLATVTSSSKEKEEIADAVKKTEAFIRKVRTILIDDDAEDENAYLDRQLTNLLDVTKKARWYVRRIHDFMALWYLLYDLTAQVSISRRDEIRNDLNNLLRAMKKESKGDETEIEPFKTAVHAFRAKYAVAKRKIQLTHKEKDERIKRQDNKCPLCGTTLYNIDDAEGDHVIAIAVQGPDEHENIQVVHKFCNRSKGAR